MSGRHSKRAVCAAAALFACAGTPSAIAGLPPAENFIGFHAGKIAISPSGHYVAILEATGPETSQLAVAPFEDGKVGAHSNLNFGKAKAVDVAFKGNDRILVTVLQKDIKVGDYKTDKHEDLTTDRTFVISFKRDGSDAKILMNNEDAQFGSEVEAMMPNDPDHVILSNLQIRTLAMSLFKVDVNTGEVERIEEGQVIDKGVHGEHHYIGTVGYKTAPDGTPFLRYDRDETRNQMFVRSRVSGGGWSTIASYPLIDDRERYDLPRWRRPARSTVSTARRKTAGPFGNSTWPAENRLSS